MSFTKRIEMNYTLIQQVTLFSLLSAKFSVTGPANVKYNICCDPAF